MSNLIQHPAMSDLIVNNKKEEYGDWQTNLSLAISICEHLRDQGISPQVIIEPTCGQGNFIIAALLTFDSIEDVYGIEIHQPYLEILKEKLQKFGKTIEQVNIHLFHESIFGFDFKKITDNIRGKTVLALGNPPWVTNSKLSEFGSNNLPQKTNFKNIKGLDAITGKGNFDIAESICIQLIEKLSTENAYFAFLLKNSVIKNLIYEQKNGKNTLSEIKQFNIDAQKEFGVSVSAALLFMKLFGGREKGCLVYDYYTKSTLYRYGWVGEKFVSNIERYIKTKDIDGVSPFVWRSGLKHDCSKVMEFSKINGQYVNALGEIADIEDDLIYPLVKSSDIKGNIISSTRKYVFVTQHSTNEDTHEIQKKYPKAYKYLTEHSEYLDNRKSSIYKGKPRFCMFGVGAYTFAKFKVVVSGLYKHTRFALLSEIEGKTAVCDDTCYMLGFNDYGVARLTMDILNSPMIQDFIDSVCFYDAKRTINKDILMRINLAPALRSSSTQLYGLTNKEYQDAAKYISKHCDITASQQSIDFESARVNYPINLVRQEEAANNPIQLTLL